MALAARKDSSGARASFKACELQNYDPDEDSREERPLHYALMVLEINDTEILDPRIGRVDPSAVAHEGRGSA